MSEEMTRCRISEMTGEPDISFEEVADRSVKCGSGTSRDVFRIRGCEGFVLKVMKVPFPRANVVEWLVWEALTKMADDYLGSNSNPDLKNKFAACIAISQTGKFLIMERLFPMGKEESVQRSEFPDWLNDIKNASFGGDSSFGKDDQGRIKVMDYAQVNFYDVLNPLNWKRRNIL